VINKYKKISEKIEKLALVPKYDEYLSTYTTIGVGGKASLFVEIQTSSQLINVLKITKDENINFFVLGNGSNVIFSDEGFDGLIILNKSKNWEILNIVNSKRQKNYISSRIDNLIDHPGILDYDDNTNESIIVSVDSGMKVNTLMKKLFEKGITGLQWFAGIPSTVGGAIYMNMHGGSHFFGQLVISARLFDGEKIKSVSNSYFHFDYDWSLLHQTREIIIDAELELKKGDVEQAKKFVRSWTKIKSIQPQKSAGCIFKNLSKAQQSELKLPSSSAGYIIDKMLQLKGTRKGGAIISNNHAAFIENTGNACADDIVYLINLVQEKTFEKLGINFELEVELKGKF